MGTCITKSIKQHNNIKFKHGSTIQKGKSERTSNKDNKKQAIYQKKENNALVVVNKTFLGQSKKFKKLQKFPLPFRSNSSELDSIC